MTNIYDSPIYTSIIYTENRYKTAGIFCESTFSEFFTPLLSGFMINLGRGCFKRGYELDDLSCDDLSCFTFLINSM